MHFYSRDRVSHWQVRFSTRMKRKKKSYQKKKLNKNMKKKMVKKKIIVKKKSEQSLSLNYNSNVGPQGLPGGGGGGCWLARVNQTYMHVDSNVNHAINDIYTLSTFSQYWGSFFFPLSFKYIYIFFSSNPKIRV